MKRFYKLVSIDGNNNGGFSIQLDGKPVKTPAGQLLNVPAQGLANAIAAEWAAQTDDIKPGSMPLTQIMTTTLDRVTQNREVLEHATLKYLDTDLLCYRTPYPQNLADRQQGAWDSWLAWFEKEFGVKLETTTELKALAQPDAAHEKVFSAVRSLDDTRFGVLQLVTSLGGSIVLGLAFIKDAISPEQLFDAVYVDENYKADIYNEHLHGRAPHEEKKQETVLRELAAAKEFLGLLET